MERRNDAWLCMHEHAPICQEGKRYSGESDTLARVRPTWPKFPPLLPRGLVGLCWGSVGCVLGPALGGTLLAAHGAVPVWLALVGVYAATAAVAVTRV